MTFLNFNKILTTELPESLEFLEVQIPQVLLSKHSTPTMQVYEVSLIRSRHGAAKYNYRGASELVVK